jgi:hypothetical protein
MCGCRFEKKHANTGLIPKRAVCVIRGRHDVLSNSRQLWKNDTVPVVVRCSFKFRSCRRWFCAGPLGMASCTLLYHVRYVSMGSMFGSVVWFCLEWVRSKVVQLVCASAKVDDACEGQKRGGLPPLPSGPQPLMLSHHTMYSLLTHQISIAHDCTFVRDFMNVLFVNCVDCLKDCSRIRRNARVQCCETHTHYSSIHCYVTHISTSLILCITDLR